MSNEVMDRVVGELRDERERLRGELARVESALGSLEDNASIVRAPVPPPARKPRERAPKGEGQAALLPWLAEHPNSGVAAICAGLGWERGKASATLVSAKKAGLVVVAGGKRDMTYSALTQ